uniref:Sodium-calcium exchanger n=1 Tax=Placopecten magellanicus TaxID=6577 RepID=Q56UU8_PLAMG|nr:sodium-calcium exchanger [Placopecten magellanicus]
MDSWYRRFTMSVGMKPLALGFLSMALLDMLPLSEAQTVTTMVPENVTEAPGCTMVAELCKPGIFFPLWTPTKNLSTGDKAARAIVYFVAMIYMFLGVSIIADRFMSAIEVITSKEKDVVIRRPDGSTHVVNVRVWNETVSNLTLMALGSSAPEILLSCIEIIGKNFEAGDLGPSTIVGSAAFNLFVITAICVSSIPAGDKRTIKHLRVFFITATWSIFAYLWMYFILSVSSYGVVEVWEAIITFVFFPITVLTAYVADIKFLPHKFLSKKYRESRQKGVVIQAEGDTEMNHVDDVVFRDIRNVADVKELMVYEQHRKEYMEIMRNLRKKHPNSDMKALEEMAELEAINKGPKSRAFYRIQATRKLTGGGKVIKKAKIDRRASVEDVKVEVRDQFTTKVFFDPGHYTVMENIGTFFLTVTREGGDLSKTLYVDYKTEDGSASGGADYDYAEGTLVFYPHEIHKQIPVSIIDDEIFEEDEHFYVRLSNVRLGDAQGMFDSSASQMKVKLGTPFVATVMILDDDHPGIFLFDEKMVVVPEAIGQTDIKVTRSSGARGTVKIPFKTVDGSAKAGKDYEPLTGFVVFVNDQTEQFINVKIYDHEEYEKNETFYVELDTPVLLKRGSVEDLGLEVGKCEDMDEEDTDVDEEGKPRLGETTRICCNIRETVEFKNVVDKLLKKANVSLVVGTSSWREQFVEAITVSAGEEDDEEAEEKLPSCMDYVMHFLTLFWKLFFAFVPPTDYFGGWACFTVSIIMIGLLTGLIGDLASGFGCTIGLKDAVTAISFVALGTSIPDTFASKVAAINDEYADSSIGNVTGSNAVNVFLGIGLAWSMAAIYHTSNGSTFNVVPGTLAMSVTVFCVEAVITVIIILIRRKFGGELGGPVRQKYFTSLFLFGLWLIYIVISSLVSYCYIPGF